MMLRRALAAVFGLALLVPAARAQESAAVRRVKQSYDELSYDSVIAQGQRVIARERLSRADRALCYELLALTYGALDSTAKAVEAFRELVRIDPDREPDVNRVAPRITALYASALGQVTVIRRVRVDSVAFVAGLGALPIRYQVSRPSRVVTRVSGPGLDALVDSGTAAGNGEVRWDALLPGGAPAPDGRYHIVLEATSGRDVYQVDVPVDVGSAAVDTLQHLTTLEGYTERPESERPPRSWRPLGIAALYAAVSSGASLGLANTNVGQGTSTGLLAVSAATLFAGFAMSVSRPEPRPVESNILYNRLLREQIARRNSEIAVQNAERRRQTLLRVTPAPRTP